MGTILSSCSIRNPYLSKWSYQKDTQKQDNKMVIGQGKWHLSWVISTEGMVLYRMAVDISWQMRRGIIMGILVEQKADWYSVTNSHSSFKCSVSTNNVFITELKVTLPKCVLFDRKRTMYLNDRNYWSRD